MMVDSHGVPMMGDPHGVPLPRSIAGRRVRTMAWMLAVLLVVGYGAYLRLDGLVARYGPFTHPAWLVSAQDAVTSTRDFLVPRWSWTREAQPYVGGDPVNYIRFAREMTGFYQAHVREPVFLAVTRGFLAVADDQDVAVSLASASFSTLAILATFLLGSAMVSRGVGLAAAAAMAVEYELVAWAPEGWRDDAFTAMVALSAWALLRFSRRGAWADALLVGVLGALATLTRITALSFLLPGLLLVLVAGDGAWRRRAAPRVLAAVAVLAVLIAPYLINCQREFGDAFHSINAHTRSYRATDGVSYEEPMSAGAYVLSKFTRAPIAQFDTAMRGLFAYPFAIKFKGFTVWPSFIARALPWLSAAGLLLWMFHPSGRLMLVVLLTSLAPYMLTWANPGGGEWRFTMHAYPFYLVAAMSVVRAVAIAVARWPRDWSLQEVRTRLAHRAAQRRTARRVAVLATVVAGGLTWDYYSPLLVAIESLRAGQATSVAIGRNDGVFVREGWSDLVTTGAVTARFAISRDPLLRVPLPEKRPYRMVLRIDPLPPLPDDPPQQLLLRLGSEQLTGLSLTFDAARVGAYTVMVPPHLGGRRLVPLSLVARRLEPAGARAAAYPGLPPDTAVAFRLWYVRLTPE